jgi:hypothetical protein
MRSASADIFKVRTVKMERSNNPSSAANIRICTPRKTAHAAHHSNAAWRRAYSADMLETFTPLNYEKK